MMSPSWDAVLLSGRSASILCPYDLDGLDAQAIADAQATHPVLIDRTGPRE
ncbi:hypothetical protein GCM10009830_24660 [Glycomyces endophyticus]|uniref:Uncharacterized protein n=1 Tax=Glycomyces endophyticus TaxID=480996 RepID=A0ABN2GV12_9ACTN